MGMLFDLGTLPRAKPLKRMTCIDAGNHPSADKGIVFECKRCGHNTGWIVDKLTISENKRGIPCPVCNNPDSPAPQDVV